jgi:hypothetical protein
MSVNYLECCNTRTLDGDKVFRFNKHVDEIDIQCVDGFYADNIQMVDIGYLYVGDIDGYIICDDDDYQVGDE